MEWRPLPTSGSYPRTRANTLAINLGLGLDNRHSIYDCKVTHRHRNADAADEIGVWAEWLKKQGAKRVTLLGHSRGGAQTALYAAERDNALVKAMVLLTPATRENTDAAGYQQRYGKPLAPVLEKAQELVRDGKGSAVLEQVGLMTCSDTLATADAFVSYYGPKAQVDTPDLLPKIKKPTLVVVFGKDQIVVDLDKKVAPLADGSARFQVALVMKESESGCTRLVLTQRRCRGKSRRLRGRPAAILTHA